MDKNDLSQAVASILKKTALVLTGAILSLVLLEAGIRLGGFILSSVQKFENLRSIKQKGAYRILCLGESTTQGQYPRPLEQILNQHNIGVRFNVIDEGKATVNTFAILGHVESYLDEYRPNMVVAMMGSNDEGVKYYQAIPESDTWLFRHCRVYRFGRILCMHILKKIKQGDIYGLSGSDPGVKAKPEDARTVPEKSNLSSDIPAKKVMRLDFKRAEEKPGPGNPYLKRSGLPEAEKSLRKASELHPKDDHAYVELGMLYRNQGQFLQAENFFKKAIELNPENDNAYIKLGMLYRNQGQFLQAENFFKKAIELNPENDNAYVRLALLFQKLGKFPQAEDFFEKAIEINSKNDRAYAGAGMLYRLQNKVAQAEDSFKKAVDLNPENDENQVALGMIYLQQKKFPQAEDSFRKAIELNAGNGAALLALGGLYREQGKFSQAEDLFKKAIGSNLTSESKSILRAMASLYEEMGKPELAKESAEKANQLSANDVLEVTVNNYRKLKEILDRKGIKLVCAQYPVRNIEPLKKIFGKDEGVIFVDNERVFKEAVRKGSYKEYFIDMFGGDFGHCTQKGNELLAQNIADVILREVFNK